MKKFFKNKFLYVLAALLILSPVATVPLCISVLSGATAVTATAGMIMGALILGTSVATIQYSINCTEKMHNDPNFGDIRILSGEPVGYDDYKQVEAIRNHNKKHSSKTSKINESINESENSNDLTL